MSSKNIRKQREDLVYEKKAQKQAKHAKHKKFTGNWPSQKSIIHDAIRQK